MTNLTEQAIYIYNFKHMQHENITGDISSDMHALGILNVHSFAYKHDQKFVMIVVWKIINALRYEIGGVCTWLDTVGPKVNQ